MLDNWASQNFHSSYETILRGFNVDLSLFDNSDKSHCLILTFAFEYIKHSMVEAYIEAFRHCMKKGATPFSLICFRRFW